MKPKIVFTDTPQGVRAYCPKCNSFSLVPTTVHGTNFVKCEACKFESPSSIFEIRHSLSHGDRVYPPQLLNSNGKAPQAQAQPPKNYLFESRPFADVIADAVTQPRAEMLFDCLWHEKEVAFLFADTGAGKSALAIQIADALSRGVRVQHLQGTQRPRRVLYLDFELSDTQQAARYSNGTHAHQFHENFARVVMRDVPELPKGMKFEDVFTESLVSVVEQENAEIVIVDNLTYLKPSLEDSESSIVLMQSLKSFARKQSLSMLILAHTPKLPSRSPISINSMQGSKQLTSFADSVFAIGKVPDEPNRRYVIQLKCRSAEVKYHADNVLTARLEKSDTFLGFAFDVETASEQTLLAPKPEETELVQMVVALAQKGTKQEQIAKELGISQSKVSRVLKKVNTTLNEPCPF